MSPQSRVIISPFGKSSSNGRKSETFFFFELAKRSPSISDRPIENS